MKNWSEYKRNCLECDNKGYVWIQLSDGSHDVEKCQCLCELDIFLGNIVGSTFEEEEQMEDLLEKLELLQKHYNDFVDIYII